MLLAAPEYVVPESVPKVGVCQQGEIGAAGHGVERLSGHGHSGRGGRADHRVGEGRRRPGGGIHDVGDHEIAVVLGLGGPLDIYAFAILERGARVVVERDRGRRPAERDAQDRQIGAARPTSCTGRTSSRWACCGSSAALDTRRPARRSCPTAPVVVRQVDGVAVRVQAEGDQAARIAAGQLAEVVVLRQDVVAVGRDDRARRDLVLRQIGAAVADEPVADVDRLGSRVVELDHVAGHHGGGVRHRLVDDDRTGQRQGHGLGAAGRAVGRAAGLPAGAGSPERKRLRWRFGPPARSLRRRSADTRSCCR